MENNEVIISTTPEKLALILTIYDDKIAKLEKQLKSIDSKIKKSEDKKTRVIKDIENVKSLIADLSAKPSSGETATEIKPEQPENIPLPEPQKEENIPITSPPVETRPGFLADRMGLDATGYDQGFSWEQKIDFLLKNALKPLQRGDIPKILRAIDSNYLNKNDDDLFRTLTPILSKMAAEKKIIKAQGNKRGFYYLHPSWVENKKIKPEFKDKCAEIYEGSIAAENDWK